MKNLELMKLIVEPSFLLWFASLVFMLVSNVTRNKKLAIIVPFVTIIFSILIYHVFPIFLLSAFAVIAATLAIVFIEKEHYNMGPYITCSVGYYFLMAMSLILMFV